MPLGIGAPYLKEFPFPFVLEGSFYMPDRVPLGVVLRYLEGRETLPGRDKFCLH